MADEEKLSSRRFNDLLRMTKFVLSCSVCGTSNQKETDRLDVSARHAVFGAARNGAFSKR